MNKLSNKRLAVQVAAILLTMVGFFTSFQVTLLIIMVGSLFAGNYYCGWICPFGTVQDIFSRIGKVLGIKKRKMPKVIHKYLKYSRYVIFAVVMLISADIVFSIMSYDPRGNFAAVLGGNMVTGLALAVIVSFALIAVVFDRPFCNYLCYEGAKYGLISSPRIMTINRNENTCVGCGKCDKACPMNIEVSKAGQVDSLQCINCFECTQVCPVEGTLSYGRTDFNDRTKKRLAAVAGALIIGVASFLMYSMFSDDSTEVQVTEEVLVVEAEEGEEIAGFVGEAAGLADGIYTGIGEGFRGDMTVEVTVSNEMITAITVTEYVDDEKWFSRAEDQVPDSIIDEQSWDVSAVSGATYSSLGIMEAVQNALN